MQGVPNYLILIHLKLREEGACGERKAAGRLLQDGNGLSLRPCRGGLGRGGEVGPGREGEAQGRSGDGGILWDDILEALLKLPRGEGSWYRRTAPGRRCPGEHGGQAVLALGHLDAVAIAQPEAGLGLARGAVEHPLVVLAGAGVAANHLDAGEVGGGEQELGIEQGGLEPEGSLFNISDASDVSHAHPPVAVG